MRTYLFSNITLQPSFIYSRVTFLLGAGASYALGYPLVREFLDQKYLHWLCDQCDAVPAGRHSPEDLLAYLLRESESFRTLSNNIEEVLSLSTSRPLLHQQVIDYIYEILSCAADMSSASRQTSSTPEHLLLASMILDLCRQGESTVITFNYDTAIEDAISFMSSHIELELPGSYYWHYGYPEESIISYFSDGVNWSGTQLPVVYPSGRVPILKLHGSINTTICRSCGIINYMPYEILSESVNNKFTGRLDDVKCKKCGAENIEFLIVPPGKRKSIPNLLTALWEKAKLAIEASQLVVLVGYSIPEYDFEARSLLSSTLMNKEVLLIDPFPLDESIRFLQKANPTNLTVLRQRMSEFMLNEAVRYEPKLIPILTSQCTPRYIYEERLKGYSR